jgi:ubiquinone/menaquinone biosynthesis C-methylase UbiE
VIMIIKELLRDTALQQLLLRHIGEREEINIEPELLQILSGDDFSLFQYAIGLPYYIRRIKQIFDGGTRFLEIGCGAGYWTVAAANSFKYVVGMDINSQRIAAAEFLAAKYTPKDAKICFLKGNGSSIPIDADYFDGCLCYNVITFIEGSHVQFLSELRRVTKRGGLLFLSATNLGYILWLWHQAVANRNRHKMKTCLSILMRNVLYWAKVRSQPVSYLSIKYLHETAQISGWRLLSSDSKGLVPSNEHREIFPRFYFGLPFLNEYVLEAC